MHFNECDSLFSSEFAASVGDARSKESREMEKKRLLALVDRF